MIVPGDLVACSPNRGSVDFLSLGGRGGGVVRGAFDDVAVFRAAFVLDDQQVGKTRHLRQQQRACDTNRENR